MTYAGYLECRLKITVLSTMLECGRGYEKHSEQYC